MQQPAWSAGGVNRRRLTSPFDFGGARDDLVSGRHELARDLLIRHAIVACGPDGSPQGVPVALPICVPERVITPDSLCSATWASYADVAPRRRRAAPPGWRRGRRHRTTWLHAAREDASATRCPRDTGVGVRGPATQRLGPFVAFPFRVLRREHTGERLPEHSGKPQRAGSGACCVPPRIGVSTPPNAKRPRQGARGRAARESSDDATPGRPVAAPTRLLRLGIEAAGASPSCGGVHWAAATPPGTRGRRNAST
jgi:hypothetical protein